jgi:hypothetical protein
MLLILVWSSIIMGTENNFSELPTAKPMHPNICPRMNSGLEESPESWCTTVAPGIFPPSLLWLAPSPSRMNLSPALYARWDSGGILNQQIPAFHKSQAELLKNPTRLQHYSGSILSSLIIEADPPESETAMMPTTKTAKHPKVALRLKQSRNS